MGELRIVSNGFLGSLLDWLTEVVPVLGVEVTRLHISGVAAHNCAETALGACNGAIHEGKLSNVVFVDHVQQGLLLGVVYLRVL